MATTTHPEFPLEADHLQKKPAVLTRKKASDAGSYMNRI